MFQDREAQQNSRRRHASVDTGFAMDDASVTRLPLSPFYPTFYQVRIPYTPGYVSRFFKYQIFRIEEMETLLSSRFMSMHTAKEFDQR